MLWLTHSGSSVIGASTGTSTGTSTAYITTGTELNSCGVSSVSIESSFSARCSARARLLSNT